MANIAKMDIDSITEFQREMHNPVPGDALFSPFVRKFQKTTWRCNIQSKLHCSSNEKDFIYDLGSTYHYLRHTYMRSLWPALRVKEGFSDRIQICWPHNLGTSHIESASFVVNEDIINTFDNVWCDMYFQFFMKPNFRGSHNINVGNLEMLENWSSELPEYTTTVHQPFSFARDDSRAFPILLLNSQAKAYHRYTMKNKIQDILRMRVLRQIKNEKQEVTGQVWQEIQCNLAYIEGAGSSGQLKTPEVWGEYIYFTPEEQEVVRTGCVETAHHFVDDKLKETGDFEYRFYMDDIVSSKATNAGKLGDVVSVDLDCETPAKFIIWVAENLTAKRYRNTSNYTTNADTLYKGWNPCTSISMYYGGQPRIQNMDIDHFDRMTPWYKTLSPADEPGYNIHCIADNAVSLDSDIGLAFHNLRAKLNVHLNDTNPSLKPVKTEEKDKQPYIEELEDSKVRSSNTDAYNVHVRMMVVKKLAFRWNAQKKDFIVVTH